MAMPGAMGVLLRFDVHKSMFFDKDAVMNALTKMERLGLSRASLLVRRTAQKSIVKMGMAKPKLAAMKANEGMSLADIMKLPGVSADVNAEMRDSHGRFLRGSGAILRRNGMITEADRRKILERIREIKAKEPSAPGQPPHTHVPGGHMLGFRRNIYNEYDSSSHSAVAGPSRKGRKDLPGLHEKGGPIKLTAYALIPEWLPNRRPIIRWVSSDTTMGPRWKPLGKTRMGMMPKRPFMLPALMKSKDGIEKAFRDTFKK
jgi:hypothetical protein